MITNLPPQPTDSRTPLDPWLVWRVETPGETEILSVAQLAECRCPELCDRDHANE
jgi:hypothetical protein